MQYNWHVLDEIKVPDAISMFALRHKVFLEELGLSDHEVDSLDQSCHHLYVIEKIDVIACLRLCKTKRLDKEMYQIGRVCVHPSYRNQGIARKMIGMAVVKGTGFSLEPEFETHSQVYLLNFYKSLGFEPVGDPYLEDGIPHLRMLLSQSTLLEEKKAT